MPNDSIHLTDVSIIASWPTSVDWNQIARPPEMTMITASMPSHLGWAATLANVSRGDMTIPKNRDMSPIGAVSGAGWAGCWDAHGFASRWGTKHTIVPH